MSILGYYRPLNAQKTDVLSRIHPLIKDVPSAHELVRRIVHEAEEIIAARLSGMMQPKAQAAEALHLKTTSKAMFLGNRWSCTKVLG